MWYVACTECAGCVRCVACANTDCCDRLFAWAVFAWAVFAWAVFAWAVFAWPVFAWAVFAWAVLDVLLVCLKRKSFVLEKPPVDTRLYESP